MNSLAHGLAVYILLAVAGAAIGSTISALLIHYGRHWLHACSAPVRQRLLFALLMCPVIAAIALMVSMSAPAAFFAAAQLPAHCTAQSAVTALHCQWHAPQILLPVRLAVGILAVAGLGLIACVLGLTRMFAAQRRLHFMRKMADWQADGNYHLLPMQEPLAFAAGLANGEAFISRGLRDRLASDQLSIVLAHEQVHIRHRDMLATVIAHGLTKLHLPGLGGALYKAWHLAVEQRCDLEVAQQTGDSLAVADCLIQVARLRSNAGATAAGACHLIDGNLAARVKALLTSPGPPQLTPAVSLSTLGFAALSAVSWPGRRLITGWNTYFPVQVCDASHGLNS